MKFWLLVLDLSKQGKVLLDTKKNRYSIFVLPENSLASWIVKDNYAFHDLYKYNPLSDLLLNRARVPAQRSIQYVSKRILYCIVIIGRFLRFFSINWTDCIVYIMVPRQEKAETMLKLKILKLLSVVFKLAPWNAMKSYFDLTC